MSCFFQKFWSWTACFMFFSFLGIHHAQMKTPAQSREIASYHIEVHPSYDASWKF